MSENRKRRSYDDDYEVRSSSKKKSSSSSRSADKSRSSGGSSTGKNRRRKGKRAAARRRRKMIIIALEAIVLIALIGGLFFMSKFDKLQSSKLAQASSSSASDTQTKEELSAVEVEKNTNLSEETTIKLEGFTTLALFGVDSRTGILGKGSRSDTIIIAAINNDTKEVKLCSVYRDTYLNLTNGSYNKCNAAYAFGGPDQALKMLNTNLDLNITKYASVDFRAIADAVDALGGVEVDVTEAEYEHLNNYTVETSEVVGRTTTKLPGPGTYNLDGIQAVSYCRIRYTAGDDFKRAERQRDIVMKIIEKAKNADVSTLNEIINKVFPECATNLTIGDVTAMAAEVLNYNITGSDGFPFEKTTGTFGSKGSCVVAKDLATNVQQLHSFLYGDTEPYTVSSTVQDISTKISNDTGVYAK